MAAPPWSLSVAQTVALIEEKLAAAGYDHTVDRAAAHRLATADGCSAALAWLLRGFEWRRRLLQLRRAPRQSAGAFA